MGCDFNEYSGSSTPTLFQSTHPHGVRRTSFCAARHSVEFQSTHPHGVRHSRGSHFWHKHHRFNPRTRMGCDTAATSVVLPVQLVSIHAPAWGATQLVAMLNDELGFQSTHPHGVRLLSISILASSSKFQSTHPHGVRREQSSSSHVVYSFNPRTRMGCDCIFSKRL